MIGECNDVLYVFSCESGTNCSLLFLHQVKRYLERMIKTSYLNICYEIPFVFNKGWIDACKYYMNVWMLMIDFEDKEYKQGIG